MKTILTASALLVLASSPALAWERVMTEEQFRSLIVDRQQIVEGQGHIVWQSDGRVSGQMNGQQVRGAWQWHQGFLCRNLVVRGQETGTNCLLTEIQGNRVRGTRDQGRGEATIVQMR